MQFPRLISMKASVCYVHKQILPCHSQSNMKRRNNKLEHCYRSLTVLTRSATKCTTKPVGNMLDKLAIEFEATAFKAAFCSLFFEVPSQPVVNTEEHTISLSPLPSGLVSEHEQIGGQIIRMRYRMSVIYVHPVIAATRALRFADHVTKRNGGSGDENGIIIQHGGWRPCGTKICKFVQCKYKMVAS